MSFISKIEYLLCGPAFIFLLLGTGLFFTIYLKFPQIRLLGKSIRLLLGLEKGTKTEGETSPFQALATSLGGSIGVGCIAGTGVALNIGGPSSIFWMLLTTFFGMTTKYVEVALCHKYREKSKDGTMSGAPMYFLKNQLNLPWLAVIMALATIGCAFVSGNMPQANSIVKVLYQTFGIKESIAGAIMSVLVGFIILGGIKRIGALAEKLIPLMSLIFLVISVMVIVTHSSNLLPSIKLIFMNPFSGSAAAGGFIGAGINLIIREGVNRSLFTNEAGSGSSGMAHASSKESNSYNEGVASIIEPFFSTAVMCSLTALVILTAGTWNTKYKNKFDRTDMILLEGKFTDQNNNDIKKLNDHFKKKKKIPLFNSNLNIKDGKILNDNLTIINLNSIAEDITVSKNNIPYTGIIYTESGKISDKNKGIEFIGKSLVTGPLPATIAFKMTPIGKWGPYLMNVCLILFALTTVLAWFYYADRSLIFLGAGKKILFIYRIAYPAAFFVGSITALTLIWSLATIFYALMGIPCLTGMLLMRKKVKELTDKEGNI